MSDIGRRRAARAGWLLATVLALGPGCTAPEPGPPPQAGLDGPRPPASASYVIDTHNHLFGQVRGGRGLPGADNEGAAREALATMDRLGIRTMLLMPPPFAPDRPEAYDIEALLDVVRRHPGRFALLGGGGSLNPLLHQAVRDGRTTPEDRARFEQAAQAILERGAVGFGELAAEHLSLGGPTHPYLSAPPDHPLLLRLADIAARHDVPIDLHMEAVSEDMPLPGRLAAPPNPRTLHANIRAFERLLAHNRGARIVWAHAGWDNTGQRTVALAAELLARHPNLYMSLKVGGDSGPANRPAERGGGVKPEWVGLIQAFPERFVLGSDQFYVSPRADRRFPRHPEATIGLLTGLPPDLARRVAFENARRIFRLGSS